MPDQPPTTEKKKLKIDDKPFDGDEHRPPVKIDSEEVAKILTDLKDSLEHAGEYDFSGNKIEKRKASQRILDEKKPFQETISEEFKKFADEEVVPEFLHLSWTQTTRGLTNRPDDKETDQFIEYIIREGKNILQHFFGEAPMNNAQRTYIRDGVYKELERKELNIPFYKKSLEEFFGKVFLGLPTNFNCDERR